ncbi:magnesium-translocating P-type ATPase, partial [Pseudomonas chlororaphis]
MTTVKTRTSSSQNPTRDDTRLSMRAAREAQNSLGVTLDNVKSNANGLTELDAEGRLQRDGFNEVAHDRPPHALVQLLQAFNNPFIYVLMTLTGISFFTDFWLPLQAGEETDLTGVIIVLVMVLASGLMRFWQEYRSAKAAEALKAMVRTTATVLRREQMGMKAALREVPMRDLVVGDIVQLSAGDMIPADIRLIESRDLFISQAVLTGEALPVEKYDTLGAVQEKSAHRTAAADQQDLLDLPNICFMGTNVVSGTATAVVVATGSRTYFGSLARSIVGSRTQTAFDRGVNSVSWLLIRFMLVMVPVVLLINGFTKGDWAEAFMFALAVAVGLTPEMLPMIVSANLAKGAAAMAKRKVVVKRLNAIQNFGAMDVLCTDKTGTLTQDRIILEHHVDISGSRCDQVLQLAWLNSYHQSGMKNLMDRAVVSYAENNPKFSAPDAWSKVDELPFDFVRRRLSVILADDSGHHLLVCKGAVEEMLDTATRVRQDGVTLNLDAGRRAALLELAEEYNRDGFRVLLVGTRDLAPGQTRQQYSASDERELIIEGFLTFLDPPKETAGPAIAALRENGVTVKVLTGDNPIVTAKICREVGLEVGEPLLGRDIERMDDALLA